MILLLGGTIDSREIAQKLKKNKIDFITTTVSEYGKFLAEEFSTNVVQKTMNEDELVNFIKENKISVIIDATHPFARIISENAVKASQKSNIIYLRYERPEVLLEQKKNIFFVENINEASEKAMDIGENILLTIGSRGLRDFKELVKNKNVYARVLPESYSLKACEEAGITAGKIIAMQGPFSKEFNKLLIKEKNINLIITKESGKAGGVDEKISSALDSEINIIIIKRPEVIYPVIFNNIDDLIKKIMEVAI